MGNAPSALHQAVLSGDVVRCRVAVQEHPSEIDVTEPTNGWTGLHIASAKGYDVIARELLARGAAPNIIDKHGRTALHLAAAEGCTTVVKDLLRKGADPLSRDTDDMTPLDAAVKKQHSGIITLLSDALTGRGITTPTGSPAAWQARAAHQADVAVAQGTAARVLAPNLARLDIQQQQTGAAAAPSAAYPHVPAPLQQQQQQHSDWLSQLPVPPGISVALPSAPPPPAAQAATGIQPVPQRLELSQPQQQLPDYYSYIRPLTPAAPEPTGGNQHTVGGAASYIPPYPAVPSAAAPPPPIVSSTHPPQQHSWPLQQQQQPWPPSAVPTNHQRVQPHPLSIDAAAAEEEEEDDWGVSAGDDDWGAAGLRSTADSPAGRPAPDLGAAVSGASKVVGVMANTAVAGARHLLTGLLQKPTGKGGNPEQYTDMPGATTAGPAGRTYSYDELARATGGFTAENKLGSGGYGPVYRGVLDGVPVAVKVLEPGDISSQGPKEFTAEITILSRLHHPHIVLLMGSCPERCALVYELMNYGSLEQHLFSPMYPDLQWQDRLRIACEVVSALVFLHSAPEPIIHMDLKPANLLLNKALVCKVGDVGLSRFMPGVKLQLGPDAGPGTPAPPVSTVLDSRLVGTPSYMDPEYLRTGRFGPRSDTYSLGVILLQMLTGIDAVRVISEVGSALARCQGDAASFATIIDSRSGSWPITEAASFAHLAMRCVELSRAKRPDLRGEVLPALLQLAERAKLYDTRALKKNLSLGGGQPPSMFICPITQDVMVDPVFAADGYTYEREAIAGWIQYHNTSPMTNLALAHTGLTPNLALRSAIRDWQDQHGSTG